MTVLQKFREKLSCEEETSDQQRSILLVDIMNAFGFSKTEREIHRHETHLRNVLLKFLLPNDIFTYVITRSTSEGMCGGMYNNKSHHDYDLLLTARNIKLCTPRTNNINNHPLLSLHDNEDYDAFFLSKKMTTFQDMSNYHWRK